MRNVATIGLALGIAWLATGCTLDMKVGDWLKPDPDGNGNGNGSSGSGSGGSGSGTAGKDGGPPATPECTAQEQGSNSSCKDVATWKGHAYDVCQSSGLQLGDYVPQEECGEGLYRYVSYSCCKVEPPVPTPSSCIDAKQGDATSCKDVGTWKQYAYDACQSSGLQLGKYVPQEECGEELYRYVSYSCCKVEPPVPTPSSCIDAKQGDATSCKDAGTWKQHAYDVCQSSGLQLGDYFPQEECGKGLYRYVSYSCCKVEPPVPTPSKCIDAKQGDATSCKDTGTWKQYAYDACQSSGQQLGNYIPQEECGEGLFRYVSYTCCSNG